MDGLEKLLSVLEALVFPLSYEALESDVQRPPQTCRSLVSLTQIPCMVTFIGLWQPIKIHHSEKASRRNMARTLSEPQETILGLVLRALD